MANEATLIIETSFPISMTVADGTGIEKGAILTLSDPMTVALCTTDVAIVAGIASGEKINADGITKIGVYRSGIFKVKASGSIAVGDAVVTAAGTTSNTVMTAAINNENILGIAMETATTGETFYVELKPMVMNLA